VVARYGPAESVAGVLKQRFTSAHWGAEASVNPLFMVCRRSAEVRWFDRMARNPGVERHRGVWSAIRNQSGPACERPPRKGLTVSRSFGQTLTRLQPIKEALLQFVGRAAEKLRRQRLMTSHLMVFVMTNRFSTTRPFYSQSAAMRLPYPTDLTPDLIRAGVQLLERIYRPGFHYQKCGVMLMDLSPAVYDRRDLFDTRDQARQARLMGAFDSLNADHGAHTVHFGSFGGSRPAWAMRQQFCSPRYTTQWQELPVVR
jgi:DNA polymerase V